LAGRLALAAALAFLLFFKPLAEPRWNAVQILLTGAAQSAPSRLLGIGADADHAGHDLLHDLGITGGIGTDTAHFAGVARKLRVKIGDGCLVILVRFRKDKRDG